MDVTDPLKVLSSDEPGAPSLDEVLKQVSRDDQEGWEYEYSATETETFYLTVDLSYPEFKDRQIKPTPHTRGGYYKNREDTKNPAKNDDKVTRSSRTRDATSDDDAPQIDDDNEAPPVDPALLQGSAKGKEKAKTPEKAAESEAEEDNEEGDAAHDIQILDLHSDHPIISYRGRVFEASWAEVIGTEAILTHHDEAHPLPALRNLSAGIDVLAASSARLVTTEKIPEPHEPEEDTLAAVKREWNIRIPLPAGGKGKDQTGERADQLRFLENLMALKKKRGDTDNVTVYAKDAPGKDWDDTKGLDFRPRRKNNNNNNAKARSGRVTSRPAMSTPMTVRSEAGGLSTPTPTRWEDLDEDDDMDEDEEGDENGEEDEDVVMIG